MIVAEQKIVTAQAVLLEIVRGTRELVAIATAVSGRNKDVVMAVQRLKGRGLVRIEGRGLYVATDLGHAFVAQGRQIAGGQDSPRPRTRTRGLRQRAWWVLRARGVVSLPDLLATLADGSERDAHSNLSRYLRALERTGYLAPLAQRQPGQAPTSNGHKRYRLVRDTGRQAPVVRQTHSTVFDPNSGEVFALGGEA